MKSMLLRFTALLPASVLLSQCISLMPAPALTRADKVVISVKEQKLGVYEKGRLKQNYKISTSKFGPGSDAGRGKTPITAF